MAARVERLEQRAWVELVVQRPVCGDDAAGRGLDRGQEVARRGRAGQGPGRLAGGAAVML